MGLADQLRYTSLAMKHFALTCRPEADGRAIVHRGNLRVSVLAPGIVRIEHDPSSRFEDRASQHFWHRCQPVPDFSVDESGGRLRLRTERMALEIPLDGIPSPDNVLIRLEPSAEDDLRPVAACDASNLGGCLRTLDTVR